MFIPIVKASRCSLLIGRTSGSAIETVGSAKDVGGSSVTEHIHNPCKVLDTNGASVGNTTMWDAWKSPIERASCGRRRNRGLDGFRRKLRRGARWCRKSKDRRLNCIRRRCQTMGNSKVFEHGRDIGWFTELLKQDVEINSGIGRSDKTRRSRRTRERRW